MADPVGQKDDAEDDLVLAALTDVVKWLDVLFGSIAILLASVGTWLLLAGRAHWTTIVGLWLFPVLNVGWSAMTRHHEPIRAQLVRGAIALPLATFLYVNEADGLLRELWVPAMMMPVGISMSLSISTRRARYGMGITGVYAAALFVTGVIRFGTIAGVLEEVLGVVMTGIVMSLIGRRLGQALAEVRSQRDRAREQRGELTMALEELQREMERRARVEAELYQAQKLESVGRLAAGIAHEINTPVQYVSDSIGFIRTAMGDLVDVVGQLQAKQDPVAAAATSDAMDLPYVIENIPLALDRAVDGLGRVSTIVRSMKEFAHPDARTMGPAALNRAIESTLAITRNEYKYVADLETSLSEIPMVVCHIGELNQAILNIVVNAAHAIGEASAAGAPRGTIRVATACDGDHVLITISDTGAGIPVLVQSRIFEPFFTTKDVGRGTGQGLAIARSVIVEKHHGTLTFETEAGKGTTFFIRIPIDGAAAQRLN